MRLHGKGTHLDRICEFGEKVHWYVPKKRRTKLEAKWRNGISLSRSWNSDQNVIGLADGTVTCQGHGARP